MLEKLQVLNAGLLETAQIETRLVRFAEGDVVTLKHNSKLVLLWEPFSQLFLGRTFVAAMTASLSAPCVLTGLSRQREIRYYIYCRQWTQQRPTSVYFRYCTERWFRMVRNLSQVETRSYGWKLGQRVRRGWLEEQWWAEKWWWQPWRRWWSTDTFRSCTQIRQESDTIVL